MKNSPEIYKMSAKAKKNYSIVDGMYKWDKPLYQEPLTLSNHSDQQLDDNTWSVLTKLSEGQAINEEDLAFIGPDLVLIKEILTSKIKDETDMYRSIIIEVLEKAYKS